jgi:TPR repeat protein
MVLLGAHLLQHSAADSDKRQAVEFFKRAAALGNVDAQYNLGVCLQRGFGVPADDLQAERAYRAAASRGHRSAQLALGSLTAHMSPGEREWSESAYGYRLAD